MIIQTIGLFDDRDKELDTYAMSVRESYGSHFPELAKIVQDNILYVKAVQLMGDRTNASKLDFSKILPEAVETELKEAAMVSKGTKVSDLDLMYIKHLCNQVFSLAEYRAQLYDYLKSQMNTIAPNLTALVGELVGARLIAHGGSLLNLAKLPGSAIQILGADNAFKASNSKHVTPKYGLIHHASLICQAAPKYKLKIARSLAAKTALAIRYDALGDNQDNTMGLENRLKLNIQLRNLEGRELLHSAGSAKGKPMIESYKKVHKKEAGMLITPAKTYNPSADSVLGQMEAKAEKDEEMVPEGDKDKKDKKKNKEKKKKEAAEVEDTGVVNDGVENEDVGKKELKKKKHVSDDAELQNEGENVQEGEKKKNKIKHAECAAEVEDTGVVNDGVENEVVGKKEQKKKKHVSDDAELQNEGEKLQEGEKKKKKRKNAECAAEVEDTGVVNDGVEIEDVVKKEKKKKKQLSDDTELQNEGEIFKEREKKKKKRKHDEADGETEKPSKEKEKRTKKTTED